MYLIVGLGNPDPHYKYTRHNFGMLAVDNYVDELKESFSRAPELRADLVETKRGDKKVIFMRPRTYMNDSGSAVRAVIEAFKIPTQQVLVLYDDTTLPFGEIDVRGTQSSAGHNGMKSIYQHWPAGAPLPVRLRIGIDEPNDPTPKADYVLSSFSKEERAELPEIFKKTREEIDHFIA